MAAKSNTIIRLKLAILFVFACILLAAIWRGAYGPTLAQQNNTNAAAAVTPTPTPTPVVPVAAPAASAPSPSPEVKLEGCVSCHNNIEPMHRYNNRGDVFDKLDGDKDAQGLTCTSCHGGNPVAKTQKDAHVQPRFPKEWDCKNGDCPSRNPERTNTLLARESRDFVRFMNPGDLRVVAQSCGECHADQSRNTGRSGMAHGAMLWGAALYNNGGFPIKDTQYGESYNEDGKPQALFHAPSPTREEQAFKGFLPFLQPLPRWEITQPGNILRVFERGGRRRLEVGNPDREEEGGKPDKGLSPRGLGTNNRTDPVYLGLQKTRLLDPTLNFLGTNDHAGDYRSSGCTACHVAYANDTSIAASGPYVSAGNQGFSQSADTQIPRNEPGHPIKHQFTSQIPTTQCMTCHMHPGTNMVATYLGRTWWDNESDGKMMYPADKQINPSQSDEARKLDKNPEGASLRGKWSDSIFLQQTGSADFNSKLKNVQFADSHGHGWMFKNVYKKDRKGNLLDAEDKIVAPTDPDKFRKAVHLQDIHLGKGMHCADCHFQQDNHGTGILFNEPRAAVEIGCVDCHGSLKQKANGITSGYAAQPAPRNEIARRERANRPLIGRDLTALQFRATDGKKLSVLQVLATDNAARTKKCTDEKGNPIPLVRGDIVQNSIVEPGKCWKVTQTADTVTPGNPDYNEKSAYAKTMQRDAATWGDAKAAEEMLAHRESSMTCYACHTSWVTSCFGCHLSMEANRKMPNRHNEGGDSRNFTSYNYQVIRDDIFMLGKDGTVTGHKVAPVRSSSAVLVSSRNQNREWIYHQQQTLSAEGFNGQAFNTHVPHTVRGKETQTCSDCHVSKNKDNNAWLAQVMLQGTNFVNFMGRYVYVAGTHALEAVAVTEHTEPQAVYGSNLHKLAYKDNFDDFVKGGRELKEFYENKGKPEVLQVQVRGEYAYAAAGKGGLRVYDIAQIDHKGFSERIVTAPVSPLGQKFYVSTKYATAVAAPSTLAVDPARWRTVQNADVTFKQVPPEEALRLNAEAAKAGKPAPAVNEEGPIHPLYAYLYVADKFEGLILVNTATLLDGDPQNNFLSRSLTYNPDGALTGANNITLAGNLAYVTTDRELVVIDLNVPLQPRVLTRVQFDHPRAVAVQFLYAFVVDQAGMHVLDIKELQTKGIATRVTGATVPLKHAHDVYVARTCAYVANGEEGVAIIDVERPEQPRLDQTYNAEGTLNDTHSVKVAMTNASLYAYVADGRNGLKILQLTDPETMPNYAGFSPRPEPRLIATFKTKGEAIGISKGLDRDRAADESGNQIAVFGRRGARPFGFDEVMRMLRTNSGTGDFFTVSDTPTK
ncbi:MAG: multiheme c-type cytochrome [Pyrinomonadaceae bacterium]